MQAKVQKKRSEKVELGGDKEGIRIIPRQLNQTMTTMVTELSDYFLQ
jgi:hypothetical protein